MKGKRTSNLNITPELADKIKIESERLGIGTISGFVRMLVVRYFEEKEEKGKREAMLLGNSSQK